MTYYFRNIFTTIKTTYEEYSTKFSSLNSQKQNFYGYILRKKRVKVQKIKMYINCLIQISNISFFIFLKHPICYRKPHLLLMIQVFLLVEIVYTDTKKKKIHIIVKPIHSSLRSESKINKNKNTIFIDR